MFRLVVILISSFLISYGTSSGQGASDRPPENAQPGECFARVLVPDTREVVTEQIVDRPSATEIVVIPATYETQTKQVLIKEETVEYRVIPATYDTVTTRVLSEPERTETRIIPAEYETYSEEVLVRESYTTWKPGKGLFGRKGDPSDNVADGSEVATGELLCKVIVPPLYTTVKRTRLKSPERTETTVIPARYETVTKQIVVQPPKIVKEIVPAVYDTVVIQRLVEPARQEQIVIPATYKTVERRVVVGGGGLEWRPVLCDTNTTPEIVAAVQTALNAAGFITPVSGEFGPQTLSSLEEYQRANGLAVGYLTEATVESLGIRNAQRNPIESGRIGPSQTPLLIRSDQSSAANLDREWLSSDAVNTLYAPTNQTTDVENATRVAAASFHHPHTMVVNETYNITSVIAFLGREETEKELQYRISKITLGDVKFDANSERLDIDFISAGSRMRAEIGGANFDFFDNEKSRVQALNLKNDDALAQWFWKVTPNKTGTVQLSLQIFSIADDGVESLATTFRREITVLPHSQSESPSPLQTSTRRIAANFQTVDSRCSTHNTEGTKDRFALVVANQTYNPEIGTLVKTIEDGETMRDAFLSAGYNVTHCQDAETEELEEQVDNMVRKLVGAKENGQMERIGVFYYSGHGVSLHRDNGEQAFMLPLDFKSGDLPEIASKAVSLDTVLVKLSAAHPSHLALLFDACRETQNNQINSISKGLHRPQWSPDRTHVYLGYADKFNRKTDDDGKYSKALSAHILSSNDIDILDLLNSVQNDIADSTGWKKFPEYEDYGTDAFLVSRTN